MKINRLSQAAAPSINTSEAYLTKAPSSTLNTVWQMNIWVLSDEPLLLNKRIQQQQKFEYFTLCSNMNVSEKHVKNSNLNTKYTFE